MQGSSEAQTETYETYVEGALEPLTQQCARRSPVCPESPGSRVTWRWKPLGKDPPAVPHIVPNGEEPSTYKLADVRRDTYLAQAINDKVVHYEINNCNYCVAAGNFAQFAFEVRITENPVAL